LSEGASTEVYAPFVETNGFNEANITYLLNVTVDPENKITEGNETNNSMEARVGPDLVVSNIKVSPSDDCNSTIIATIENKGILNATDFFVKLNISGEGEREVHVKDTLCQNSWKNITLGNLEPNRAYNVRVIVDARETVEELNEQNNIKDVTLGPDLMINEIKFYNENDEEIDPDKLILGENHTISVLIRNDGAVPAKDFKLKIWINTSDSIIQEFEDVITDCVLPYGGVIIKNFTWIPDRKGWFVLNATVDSENNVEEMYGEMEGESNNNKTVNDLKVGEPNYKAKPYPLHVIEGREIHGRMYYDIKGSFGPQVDRNYTYNTTFSVPSNIEFARLYLYVWGYYKESEKEFGKLPNIKVYFNNNFNPASEVSRYEEFPDATWNNYTYATICYDVKRFIGSGKLSVRAEFTKTTDNMHYEMTGMGLIVVYRDENAPLMKYYIGEGGDIIMAKNGVYRTGFDYEDCTRGAIFSNVRYPRLANATLITVLSPYMYYDKSNILEYYEGEPYGDLLRFNGNEVGEPFFDNGAYHYWTYLVNRVALTRNGVRGEYVDVEENNTAEIQSRGNYFFLTNVFLNVTYPPNIVPELNDISVPIGESYDIPVIIKDEGRSAARNFNVTFRASDGYPREAKKSVNVVEEESTKTIYFRWTAPKKVGIVKINVTVDSDNDVDELINSHVNGEKDNYDEATITVVPSELEIRPPTGGRGGGSGKGIGTGSEAGTQGGAFGGMSAGAGREGASKGEKKAGNESVRMEEAKKTLWGYLMNNIILPSEERAGGSSGFSLWEYLIKVSAFLIGIAFLVLGYLFERRRHNAAKHVRKERKSRGESER